MGPETMGKTAVFPTEIHGLHGKVMVRGRLRDSVVVLGLAFTVRLSSGEDGWYPKMGCLMVQWSEDGPVCRA